MKKGWWMMSVFVATLFLVACGAKQAQETATPASWADRYASLVASGKEAKGEEFAGLQKEVTAIREELGDAYVYIISPLKDGKVVALLGIDTDVTDLMKDFPEWNRDKANWNGYTHDVPGGFPASIQEKLDELKPIVEGYAKKLSYSAQ